jgi:hypothetical protein
MPKINHYNPNGIRHPRRTRIINLIKAFCNENGYIYTNGLHTVFNKYADEHQRDRTFTEMRQDGHNQPASLEYQVTIWLNQHFTA